MRNIHIFKTDRPTRLHGYAYGELGLSKKHLPWKEGRNIYITSDEEVNRYDYYINNNECIQAMLVPVTSKCKKVILTTDQDLIKDGVQNIDDEFLEWFVKNPSCEEVEVFQEKHHAGEVVDESYPKGFFDYKIVIPTKEPKQETHICKYCKAETTQSDDECYAKPKQDPLEEVAERLLANNIDGLMDALKDDDLFYFYKGVIQSYGEAMAKYQQERMYSKKDMEDSFVACWKANVPEGIECKLSFKEWFEQLKKNSMEKETLELVKDLAYWKKNAEEDYLKVPISVLRYISELEKTMYSEEDLIQAFEDGMNNVNYDDFHVTTKQWFEQFKKL